MTQSQNQGNQGQPGQDAQGHMPNDPGYDATTDPGSPQYDPNKAGQGSQGQGQPGR